MKREHAVQRAAQPPSFSGPSGCSPTRNRSQKPWLHIQGYVGRAPGRDRQASLPASGGRCVRVNKVLRLIKPRSPAGAGMPLPPPVHSRHSRWGAPACHAARRPEQWQLRCTTWKPCISKSIGRVATGHLHVSWKPCTLQISWPPLPYLPGSSHVGRHASYSSRLQT